MTGHVYTMPAGVPFLTTLAEGLAERFGPRLDEALILLPTRRAQRQLTEILIDGPEGKESKGAARLLPRMRPLADVNPDEPPFEPGYLAGLVHPAIASAQRRFLLAQLVGHYYSRQSPEMPQDPAAWLALADPLLSILDDAAMEEADLSRISELKEIHDFAALHFQDAILFYEILQTYWPKHLSAQNLMDPMARRVALLNELAQLWTQTPPAHPVIIAGSTGTLAATARLMACVAKMPDGLIVLPGLDKVMPDKAWTEIDAEHPQNSLKNVLGVLGLEREDVDVWPQARAKITSALTARRQIISESLTPVPSTADWMGRIDVLRKNFKSGDIFKAAWDGLSVIEAHTDEEEALSIALILRASLEDKDKTAALITPDPALARRVRARLRRWQVEVDYSQGEPLEETALGAYLSALLGAAQEPEDFTALARLAKHPLAGFGKAAGAAQRAWQGLEKQMIRNPWPDEDKGPKAALKSDEIAAIHAGLSELRKPGLSIEAGDWARRLSRAAEICADSESENGASIDGAARLWQGDSGEKAAALLDDLIRFGAPLGEMSLADFTRLFGVLTRGQVVRPRFGMHPRLQILGPLEARLIEADVIILGGLNEGVWPAGAAAQPFFSRGMRAKLGLSLPERRFGLAAHDFAELATNARVFLTRSERSDDSPNIASRWLWRLQTLTKGALADAAPGAFASSAPYLDWARGLDFVAADAVKAAARPEPRPDIDKRWPGGRKLSITQIKRWIRDPYAIYAKKVLGLTKLGDLSIALGPRDYGNAIHLGLERFTKAHRARLPQRADEILAGEFERALLEAGYPDYRLTREKVRLAQTARSVTGWMGERRAQGWQVAGTEAEGKLEITSENFTLTGRADLIEKSGEGYSVIDYKTGGAPSANVVKAGFDPQLPLTAFMLRQGAFTGLKPGETTELIYMKARARDAQAIDITKKRGQNFYSAPDYADDAYDALVKLIQAYDQKDTAYYSQPRIQYVDDYGDYDHLARRGEWALLGAEGENG